MPEDYIHRVGRTARAEAVGDAFTFVAPDEEASLRSIERVMGKRLPRVIVPDFDYAAKTGGILEIPLADRIAAIRAKKKDDRARSAAKAQRRTEVETADKARRDAPRQSAPTGAGSSSRRRPRSRTRRPGSGGGR